VGLVVTQGNQLMTTLNNTAGIEPSDCENTWENIEEMCSKIGLYIDQGVGIFNETPPQASPRPPSGDHLIGA
jgi:hypothetical protein